MPVFLYWFCRLWPGSAVQGPTYIAFLFINAWVRKSIPASSHRLAGPAQRTEKSWLSAATVRLVMSHPMRAPRGGAGLRGRGLALLACLDFPSTWRKFTPSSSLRKSTKPAGDQYLREVCRPRRPSLRAPGTMRYLRSRARKPLPPPLLLEPHPGRQIANSLAF